MSDTSTTSTNLGRAAIGGACGAALGAMAEAALFWRGPLAWMTEPLRDLHFFDVLGGNFPRIVGPLMGAFIVGAICFRMGRYELHGWLKSAVVGMLIGVIPGLIVGRSCGEPIMGMLIFIPAGAILGFGVGAWYYLWWKRWNKDVQ